MKIIYPDYYEKFRCLAGDCPDSCCRLWDIDVDPETEKRYMAVPGELGERLRNALRRGEDGTVIAQADGKCPLWREDGLCGVQTELGHEALCRVCREFPRLTHDYGTIQEWDLELSCPEAARLILTQRDTAAERECPGGEVPDYDPAAMAILRQSRNAALDLAADTRISLPKMLCALLFYAAGVQETLYGDALPKPDAAKAWETGAQIAVETDPGELVSFFRDLEILTPRWSERLKYPQMPALGEAYRPLIRYFIRRYWLQAVSDLDILGRAKFGVISCLLIGSLGGDLQETASLYSKEIENDPENLYAVLDGGYESRKLTDGKLLYLLRKAEKNP